MSRSTAESVTQTGHVRRRVFVTGSTTGLGRAAAQALIDNGHEVVVHARSTERARGLGDLGARAAGVVMGDLANASDVRRVADQANAYGTFDAVIHNAGIYVDRARQATEDGHARVLAVNVLAPYVLTALIDRPRRLIYLSSGMHHGGDSSLHDIDWISRRWNGVQAYRDSKLFVTTLAAAIARRWRDVHSNAVDPGWVPTRMGGAAASDDLAQGHVTQVWLAVSDDPEANVTGRYWYHQQTQTPARQVTDPTFQEAMLHELSRLTGFALS
jgi:NAD(P)-dependent dehydrogenase (short-subunit alcohol dehydrogenase family)